MDVFALIFLPFRVMLVFIGFTFTDVADFGPLLTLFIGLSGVALIRRSPQKRVSLPLIALMFLLSLWPILPNLGLFFMARELQAAQGSWPQVMVNDPKNCLGHVSLRFDALFHLVNYLEAFLGAWMVIFLSLFFAAKAHFSLTQRRWYMSLTLLSLFLVLLDPGHLYPWWLD